MSFELEDMVEEEETEEESWPTRSLEYSVGGEGKARFSMKGASFMRGFMIGSKQKSHRKMG